MPRTSNSLLLALLFGAIAFIAGGLVSDGGHGDVHDHAADTRLAAAGGGGGAGSSVDSCSLLSEQEASSALGGAEVIMVADPGQCTWVATDGSARAIAVAVPILEGSRRDFPVGAAELANALQSTAQPVTAGDEAYVVVSDLMSEGMARVDDLMPVVVLTNPAGTSVEQTAQLEQLLNTVISRL